MAYRIAEDPLVCLPVIVNLDGFVLSFTREPVTVPEPKLVREFLPPFRQPHLGFKASAPHALGTAVVGGSAYSYFRHQIHLASINSLQVHEQAAVEFERLFGRRYGIVEGYRLEDAEDVLVMTNAFASKGKVAVDAAREQGRRVGLLRLRFIRPWPADAIRHALQGRRAVAVLDQNLTPGQGGILFQEIAACLYHDAFRPRALCSFIGGLGGKNLSEGEFQAIFKQAAEAAVRGKGIGPILLCTEAEHREIEQLQYLAHELKTSN
jgi:pyruvate ferredoxin oxidoreductase alpha subunit